MGSTETGGLESGSHPPGTKVGYSSLGEKLEMFNVVSSAGNMWKDRDFLLVVKTYLESNKRVQEFYASVEACFRGATETLLMLTYVIEMKEREVEIESGKYGEESRCLRMLEDLIGLKARGGEALGEEFIHVTRMVYEEQEGKEQIRVLEELRKAEEKFGCVCKDELLDISKAMHTEQALLLDRSSNYERQLEKELRMAKRWRIASDLMFAIGFFTVLVLAVLVMVFSLPYAIEVLVGALSATVGSIGKWFSYEWSETERATEFQKDGVVNMKKSTYVLVKDMEAMQVLVDKTFMGTQRVVQIAEREGRVEQEDKEAVDEIRKMMVESLEMVEQARNMQKNVTKTLPVQLQAILFMLENI